MSYKRRLPRNIPSGEVDHKRLIGAKVKILSGRSSDNFVKDINKLAIIDEIRYKISLDGKTFAIIKLKGYPDYVYTWKDIQVVELGS